MGRRMRVLPSGTSTTRDARLKNGHENKKCQTNTMVKGKVRASSTCDSTHGSLAAGRSGLTHRPTERWDQDTERQPMRIDAAFRGRDLVYRPPSKAVSPV
jgi:hypothetical protein